METYSKEQIQNIEKYLFEIENNYLNPTGKFKKIREILSSPIKDKEPDGYIKENHKFISTEEYLSDHDDYIIEMWQPIYFSPVSGEVKEPIENWDEIFKRLNLNDSGYGFIAWLKENYYPAIRIDK